MGKGNKRTNKAYGGFILTFEPERTEWLAENLRSGYKLTESFSEVDWDLELRELVFIVLEYDPYSIAAFGLMEKMHGNGGFRKSKMRMTQMHVFDKPVSQDELEMGEFHDAVCTPEQMQRIGSEYWVALLGRVRNARPRDAGRIDEIVHQREAERRILGDSPRVDRLNEQRDALGLALDIASVERAPILQSISVEGAEKAESILDLLDHVQIHERSMVEHDVRVFESLLGEWPARTMRFDGKSDRSVRVLVADKTDLETVLGIDLIVYQACYDNFLLLQYKRMNKIKGGWSYPVSGSSGMHQQLAQMRSFMAKASAGNQAMSPTLWSYRLNEDPFFFKFCEQFRPDARDVSLVPGITLSAMHLDEFLCLPEAKGELGGISVGYHNCPRYLSNTDFIQLARSGWIGAGQRSVALMRKVLEANAYEGRAAMLAVIDVPKEQSAKGRDWKY